MSIKNPQEAASLYQHCSGLVVGTREIMGRLLTALVLNLEQAKHAHTRKRLDTMFEFNRKSLRILSGIRTALSKPSDDQSVAPLTRYLGRIYADLYVRLANVLRSGDPSAEFNTLLARLKDQQLAWSGQTQQPQPTATTPPPILPSSAAADHDLPHNFYA